MEMAAGGGVDGGGGGTRGRVVAGRGHPVRSYPRGYGAAWGALAAGAVALIAFDLSHHPAGSLPPRAQPRPTVTVTTHASPAGAAPTGRGAQPAGDTVGRRLLAGAPGAPTPSPLPSTPSPAPSRAPSPRIGVAAAVVAPLRGATPVAVRATLVIGAAPPFPDSIAGLTLTPVHTAIEVTALSRP